MTPNHDPKEHWRDLCADLHEEDGLTPAEYEKRKPRSDRKCSDRTTQRLCAQAGQAIRMALLADCHDSDLQSLDVERVEPWPDAKRLRVHLVAPQSSSTDELAGKVAAVAHLLRHAVAQAVTRKRAPQLVFAIRVADNSGGDEHA